MIRIPYFKVSFNFTQIEVEMQLTRSMIPDSVPASLEVEGGVFLEVAIPQCFGGVVGDSHQALQGSRMFFLFF